MNKQVKFDMVLMPVR